MKNFRFCVPVLGALIFAACSKDVSAQPEFASFVGHTYATKIDLVICTFDAYPEVFVAIPGEGFIPKLSELPSKFPVKLPDDAHDNRIIIGIMPAGSRFKVDRVIRDESSVGVHYLYKSQILTPEAFRGRKFDPRDLRVNRPPADGFDPKLVSEAP